MWTKRIKKREKSIRIRKSVSLAGLMLFCIAVCGWRQTGTEPDDSSVVRQFIIGPEEEAVYLVSASEEVSVQEDVSTSENVSDAEKESLPEEETAPEEDAAQTVSGNAVGNSSAEAEEAFAKVNQARAEIGLSELAWSNELAAAAEIRAQEIHQAFSHTRPDGSPWWTVDSENIYGENIAKGYQSAESVVMAWMESSEHKENILYSGFETIGIAVYNVDGKWYWAQEFGY